jgi:peptidyl-prolyl cis-trans isomerase A (cyclophilin A)
MVFIVLIFALFLSGCQSNLLVSPNSNYQIENPTTTIMNDTTPTPTMSASPSSQTTSQEQTAIVKTTLGDITIKLSASTPITVANFVGLATGSKEWTHPATGQKMTNKPFFDGIIFHRVIKDFMIQTGDPLGQGYGGPGYKFKDEPFTGEYTRGTVAMANSGPNTNGSQFFIMHKDMALPKSYVIFGKVVSGMEVVDKIAETPTDGSDKPLKEVSIKTVVIETK